jgi:hypothetical protein
MTKRLHHLIPTAVALLLTAGSALAGEMLPPERQAGSIGYRSGGVGQDESAAMKAAAARYPLALTFTARIGKRDAYTAGVKVRIAAAGGATVLEVSSDGPFLLVDLPAGSYQVTAENGGVAKSRNVRIKAGAHSAVVFEWTDSSQQ